MKIGFIFTKKLYTPNFYIGLKIYKRMEEIKLISISNQAHSVSYRIKPKLKAVYLLNAIVQRLDKHQEGFLQYPEQKVKLNEFVPRKFTLHREDEEYGFLIFTKDEFHLILLKSHPDFEEIRKAVTNYFKFVEHKK